MYWQATNIPAGWVVDSGYTSDVQAIVKADELSKVYDGTIRVEQLTTQESAVPFDDLRAEIAPGSRWCILVEATNE